MKSIKISNFRIGVKYPVFVIPEVGINHNGSISIAKKMVDVAKQSGALCIKFQTHIAHKEMIKSNIRPGNISKKTLWNIIKNCELDENEEEQLKNYCDKKKILFLSTPFSIDAVNRLEKLHVPAYKIGSGELTNVPFLHYVAKIRKPVILSTGMSTLNEIKTAVNIFKKYKTPLAILQTTSTYPSDYSEIKLGLIEKFQRIFNVPVGISDHSIGIYTAIAAVAKGACIIEKHFTLNKKMSGPDQSFSLEPRELFELIKGCEAVKLALGSTKSILPRERPILKFARESVTSTKTIVKDEKFTIDNIATKRPATGQIPAKKFFDILNRKARRDIPADTQLSWKDVL